MRHTSDGTGTPRIVATEADRRRFEEEAARNYAKGKIGGFLHLYIGQEAIAVAAAEVLGEGDLIFQTYRDRGFQVVAVESQRDRERAEEGQEQDDPNQAKRDTITP